jgi:cysteine synthase
MAAASCSGGQGKTMQKSLKAAPAAGALSRRTLFAGAGTAGTLAAVVALLPKATPPVAAVVATAPAVADGGYQLTEHVQRYYQTARV